MKRYALAGASTRAYYMYAMQIFRKYGNYAKLTGVYDIDMTRANIISRDFGNIPVFDNFDKMMAEAGPDTVIVTTVDAFHHEYAVRAMNAGCDVIIEKPMAIDAKKCKAILEAERNTGRKVTVTFNYRFVPYAARIKELIGEGAIGRILGADFEWMLDTDHGASYFRRWNGHMDKSGGLLVHKASHHFDLVNWWLGEDPEEVFAFGARRFYHPSRDIKGKRCLTCEFKKTCGYFWDICGDEHSKRFFYEAEKDSGYIRDGCVFADDIDIYDTMSVNVRYAKGALLTYSLIAHSPYEGWRIALNGTEGRLEAQEFHSGHKAGEPVLYINLYNRKGEVVKYDIPKSGGGHGGGDDRLLRMLFVGDLPDPLGQKAGSHEGAMSSMIGAAANVSIAGHEPVFIRELLDM